MESGVKPLPWIGSELENDGARGVFEAGRV